VEGGASNQQTAPSDWPQQPTPGNQQPVTTAARVQHTAACVREPAARVWQSAACTLHLATAAGAQRLAANARRRTRQCYRCGALSAAGYPLDRGAEEGDVVCSLSREGALVKGVRDSDRRGTSGPAGSSSSGPWCSSRQRSPSRSSGKRPAAVESGTLLPASQVHPEDELGATATAKKRQKRAQQWPQAMAAAREGGADQVADEEMEACEEATGAGGGNQGKSDGVGGPTRGKSGAPVEEGVLRTSDCLPTALLALTKTHTQEIRLDTCAQFSVAGVALRKYGRCMTRYAPVDVVEGFGGGRCKVLGVWRFRGTTVYRQAIVFDALLVEDQGTGRGRDGGASSEAELRQPRAEVLRREGPQSDPN
jgi:hypothetical protein